MTSVGKNSNLSIKYEVSFSPTYYLNSIYYAVENQQSCYIIPKNHTFPKLAYAVVNKVSEQLHIIFFVTGKLENRRVHHATEFITLPIPGKLKFSDYISLSGTSPSVIPTSFCCLIKRFKKFIIKIIKFNYKT